MSHLPPSNLEAKKGEVSGYPGSLLMFMDLNTDRFAHSQCSGDLALVAFQLS